MGSSAKIAAVPTLADLLADPRKLDGLPREAIPHLRGELAQLDSRLLSKLVDHDHHDGSAEHDQLLNVSEAAARLGVKTDFLYHNSKALPFTRHVGRSLRFSARGIDKYIRAK